MPYYAENLQVALLHILQRCQCTTNSLVFSKALKYDHICSDPFYIHVQLKLNQAFRRLSCKMNNQINKGSSQLTIVIGIGISVAK